MYCTHDIGNHIQFSFGKILIAMIGVDRKQYCTILLESVQDYQSWYHHLETSLERSTCSFNYQIHFDVNVTTSEGGLDTLLAEVCAP